MPAATRKYPKTATATSLARHFAGGIDYIRTKGGRVMALTLKNSMNPDAPDFVVFGKGPRVEARARLFLDSGASAPVYMKVGTNQWSLRGIYRAVRILRDGRSIAKYGRTRDKGKVAGVLQLERTDTDDVVLRATAFPDAKTRKEIEQAAVRFVRKSLKARGYVVRDVQADKVGYDLHAKGPRGTLLVEVKGTDVDKPRFFITQNERHCARRRSNWRLFVVVAARTKPRLLEFTREEMERVFRFDVMSWQATWNDA